MHIAIPYPNGPRCNVSGSGGISALESSCTALPHGHLQPGLSWGSQLTACWENWGNGIWNKQEAETKTLLEEVMLEKGRQSCRISHCRPDKCGSVLDWPTNGYGEVCSAGMQKHRCRQAWKDQPMVHSLLGNVGGRKKGAAS